MRLTIDNKTVIDILRNREQKLHSIHNKIYDIKKDVSDTDDIIMMVSLASKTVSDMPKGTGSHAGLEQTYEKYQKKLKERQEVSNVIMWNLILQEERIERVWHAYLALDDPYYSIVDKMYVHGEKYEAVEKESGYSRQVFEKYRKEAIRLIVLFYNSDKTDADLMMFQQMKMTGKAKEILAEEKDGQITLFDCLNENGRKTLTEITYES